MATVIGLVQSARHYLPDLVSRKKRAPRGGTRSIPSSSGSDLWVAELIERQIIPRLMVAHRSDDFINVPADAAPDAGISVAEAEAFAPLAIDLEADALLDHVEVFLRRGATIDSVFVDLLAPAARHLGELWDEDLCDFVDVTMALWRLQEIVREVSSQIPVHSCSQREASRALFAAIPGDQHGFGAVMIEDVFRRNGWATDLAIDCTTPDLLDRVARSSFDLVGLTVSLDAHIERLPSLILALRSVSRNPRICIMVGGRCFVTDPELARRVGADGTAPDAHLALDLAKRMVAVPACREVFSA